MALTDKHIHTVPKDIFVFFQHMYTTFSFDYKRVTIMRKMNRYIEMGFSRELAEEAIVRFEDDLHAGCHWLMMRETMGQIPKRLRRETVSEVTSYTGSCVRYMGLRWTVTDFDKKHALIRLKTLTIWFVGSTFLIQG